MAGAAATAGLGSGIMNIDVEFHIRHNYPWSKLPANVRQVRLRSARPRPAPPRRRSPCEDSPGGSVAKKGGVMSPRLSRLPRPAGSIMPGACTTEI